jgi:C-5 cytosine-specific DNA methylase
MQIFQRMALVSLLRAVEVLDPKFVLVENVQQSAMREGGFYVQFVMQNLLQLGFQCRLNKFQSADFGVPQSRSRWGDCLNLEISQYAHIIFRIFILGVKLGQPMPEFPDITHSSGKKFSPLLLNQIKVRYFSWKRLATI